jgi:carbamoyl-phosphate synthase large subunit
VLLSIGSESDKLRFLPSARALREMGYTIFATGGTAAFLTTHDVPNVRLYKIRENRRPSLLEVIAPGKADLVINIPIGYDRRTLTDGYIIRRRAIDFGVPLITNLQLAELLVKSLATKGLEDLKPLPYDAYLPRPPAAAPGPVPRGAERGRADAAPAPGATDGRDRPRGGVDQALLG